MKSSTAKKVRKAIRREYMRELREYYRLPLHTRPKIAYMIVFAIRPKAH